MRQNLEQITSTQYSTKKQQMTYSKAWNLNLIYITAKKSQKFGPAS